MTGVRARRQLDECSWLDALRELAGFVQFPQVGHVYVFPGVFLDYRSRMADAVRRECHWPDSP